jgi:spermidine synthase
MSGYTTLFVDGLIQSGVIMESVWRHALKSFLPKSVHPQSVLLLGLAGGSSARLINRYFPHAQITAVEIDPQMVEIGRKHFHLSKVKNLRIHLQPAEKYIAKLNPRTHFDLVLVDCFVGPIIPDVFFEDIFWRKIKQNCRFVFLNRLYYKEEIRRTDQILSKLTKKHFFLTSKTRSNILISLV